MSSVPRLRLDFLDGGALASIEETAYRLLAEVGISLQHTLATEILHGQGCTVGRERVLIPYATVQQSLDCLVDADTYGNRDGSRTLAIGDGEVYFHNTGGPPFIFDLVTDQRRPATKQDCADMTRLLDALPGVDVITPFFGPQDVPSEMLSIVATEVTLRNTTKPCSIGTAESRAEVRYKVELAAACCGGLETYRQRPTAPISISPISPLTFSEKVTDAMITAVQLGAPLRPLPAPSLGATSPVTLAGALAQQHAEILASFVLAAAVRPGARVSYSSRINPIDMRTAVSAWGGPELGMAGACAAQLAHRIGFTCDAYGFSTSSSRLDPQYAYERFANAMTAALGGVNILSGVGGMESGLSGSGTAAVMDDEMISLLKHIVRGCRVDESTLAWDVMKEIIPGDHVFLGHLHTARQVRAGALWRPGVSERGTVPGEGAGVVERARARAREILLTHEVPPLPDSVNCEILDILDRAQQELVA
jgi:trimethylamine---corrinoid protein Co-methyltransferase